MKLSRILRLVSAIVLLFTAHHLNAAEINHVINISPDMVKLSLLEQDSLWVTEIEIDGFNPISIPQLPHIPMADISYAIPANVRSVNVKSLEFGEVMSYPITAPIALSPKEELSPDFIDKETYIQSLYDPQNIIKTIDSYKGINNVVRFSIPLAVIHSDHVDIYKSIYITLDYDQNEEQSVDLRIQNPTYYINSGEYDIDIRTLKDLVENPQDVNEDAYTLQKNKVRAQSFSTSTDNWNGEVQAYQYCIVTPKKFANAFRRVASIKRAKGINAGVVYLENILSDERFKNGTLKPSNSSPEVTLREFLYWSYINGCRYALLGGKPPLVPAAYAISDSPNDDSFKNFDDFIENKSEWWEYYIPTDLYFSNFDNNWDSDGDGLYGEPNDKLSYNSQLAIGRLPCTKEEEIINYVHKLEFYELGFGGSLKHYGKCHSILASYYKESAYNSVKEFYKDIVSSCSNVFESATFYSPFHNYGEEYFPLTGQKAVAILNREAPCFINVHGHGNPTGFGFDKDDRPNNIWKPYGVNALDSEPKYHWDEEGNGLDCMDNFGMPSILYASSCTIMPFDCPKYDNYGYFSSDYDDISCNFGESFVLGKNYGGVAMIGNTRYGWILDGKRFSEYFLDNMSNSAGMSPTDRNDIFKIMNSAKVKTNHDFTSKAMNIFGDPSLCIRNNDPVNLTNCFSITRTMDGTIIDRNNNANGLDNAAFYELAVVSSTGNNYSKSALIDYGIEDKSIDPNDMVYICQWDAIPYVSDLEFAGDNLKSGYIYCNNANIGCRASNRKQTVTKVYGKTTIDAMGDVKLGATLDIAGDLVIYAKGFCTLDSVSILSNGNLEIHCDDIHFAEDYEQSVSNNGKLQFYNYDKYDSEPKPYMSYKPKALRAKSEHEYTPLLEEGKAWWYNYKVVTNLANKDVYDRNLTLKLESRKEIDGKDYSVLNLYIDGVFDDVAAYLYEDIDSKRVYVKTEDYGPSILDHWFAVHDGLLYDFNDPEMPVFGYLTDNNFPVEIEANGNTYFGWKHDEIYYPMAAVEGLGLIPYTYEDGKFALWVTATLLGERAQVAGGTLNIYPYLYKITDKNGNVLFEIKGNEFSSLPSSPIDNKIYARTEGKIILIDNPLATHVSIIDAAGMQIHQSSDTNIRIEASPGLYMVIGGNDAIKLIVK